MRFGLAAVAATSFLHSAAQAEQKSQAKLQANHEAIQKVLDRQVSIRAFNVDGKTYNLGTGIWADKTNVLTASHIVEGELDRIEVSYGDTTYPAQIKKTGDGRDIALLEVPDMGQPDLSPLDVAENDMTAGETLTLKSPWQEEATTVLAHENLNGSAIYSAGTEQGNSGGVVVDEQGQVAGVISQISDATVGRDPFNPQPLKEGEWETTYTRNAWGPGHDTIKSFLNDAGIETR